MESVAVGSKGLDEFQAEIAVLTKVRHRHLVALEGYCINDFRQKSVGFIILLLFLCLLLCDVSVSYTYSDLRNCVLSDSLTISDSGAFLVFERIRIWVSCLTSCSYVFVRQFSTRKLQFFVELKLPSLLPEMDGTMKPAPCATNS